MSRPPRLHTQDSDFTLWHGDAFKTLYQQVPSGSIDCCVTSPPYWGLRDYGHTEQLGLEPTPEAYAASLVAVFREVRRCLTDAGTVWLNLGDSYSHGGNGSRDAERWPKQSRNDHRIEHRNTAGAKPKDLVGIPWRVAFALQADGWYLRSDIIWSKPNPMPESVTDRPTKAHEYVFLLSKAPRYFYDNDAIREPAAWDRWGDQTVGKGSNPNGWIKPKSKQELTGEGRPGNKGDTYSGFNGRWEGTQRAQTLRALELAEQHGLTEAHIAAIRAVGITDTGKAQTTQAGTGRNDPAVQALAAEAKNALGGYYREFLVPMRRNARSVWEIATQPYPEAHFAVFPEELPRRCILAGCPEGGTVLDPFGGSGTTALVARRHGRRSVLIELNADYCDLAAKRLQQLSLLSPACSPTKGAT